MKGYETADHLEANQADLAAAGEHQGVAVDDRGHRFGLGDLQRGEGGNVAAPGIRTLRARGGQTRAMPRSISAPWIHTPAASNRWAKARPWRSTRRPP